MPRTNPTIKAILDGIQANPPTRAPLRLYSPFIGPTEAANYADLADAIRRDQHTANFFFDTNFFTAHEVPKCMWDAFLGKRIVIPERVWTELIPWRINPRVNEQVVDRIARAKANGRGNTIICTPGEWGPYGLAIKYYVNLLIERRRLI